MTFQKTLKIYTPFAKSEIQRFMVYRIRFFIWVLTGYLYTLINYFLWRAIFNSTGTGLMSGFSFRDMVVYILMIHAVSRMTNSPAGQYIGREVQDGSIAMSLIRPISYSTRLFFCAIGQNLFSTVVGNGLFFLIVGVFFYDVTSVSYILLFLVSVFLSFAISHFFNICFAMFSFYTTYVWGLQMLKNALLRFLSGMIIPFAFLPGGLGRFFELLPFAGLGYTPVMIFLGKYQGNELLLFMGLQVFWALFFCGLSMLLWRWAIKRLTILGG